MMEMMGCHLGASAPRNFEQPILPGWTFGSVINVTERNSKAPDTERDIVAENSYGRQLGWVIEALAALIAERPKEIARTKELDTLIELHEKIKTIKSEAAVGRIERLKSDLALLKAEKSVEYHKIVAALSKD